MPRRKEIKSEKIPIKNRDGDVVGFKFRVELPSGETRLFDYDERIRNLENFHTQKKLNEVALKKYLIKRGEKETGKKYIVPTEKEKEEQFESFVDDNKNNRVNKNIVTYGNGNRLITATKKLSIDFNYAYLRVKIKVYYDGYYKIAFGNSDYHYNAKKLDRNVFKNRKVINNNIPDYKIKELLAQAIRRALASSGGYDVRYELLQWEYCYKQRKRREESSQFEFI